MKFDHFPDLHLSKRGSEFSMLEDQKYILNGILKTVEEEQLDAVLIAGDIYDKAIPPADAVQFYDDFLCQLANWGLQVFVISGSHDSPETEVLTAKAGALEARLTVYDQLEEAGKKTVQLRKRIQDTRGEIEALRKSKQDIAEQLALFRTEHKGLEDASVKKERLLREEELLQEKTKSLAELKKAVTELNKLTKELKNTQEEYLRAAGKSQEAQLKAENLRKAFLNAQTDIMASQLREGLPCPVCGAMSHPRRDQMTTAAPTEAEIKRAEMWAQQAREEASQQSQAACILKGTVMEKERGVLLRAKQLLGTTELSFIPREMADLSDELKDEKRERAVLLATETAPVTRRAALEKQITQLKEKQCKIEEDLSNKKVLLAALSASLEEMDYWVRQISGTLKYTSKDAAQAALKELKQQISERKNILEQTEKNYAEGDKTLDRLMVRENQLQVLLADTEDLKVDESAAGRNQRKESTVYITETMQSKGTRGVLCQP